MLEAGSRNPTLQPGTGTVLLSSPDVALSFLSTHDWPRRAQSSRYYVRLHKIDRVRPSKLLSSNPNPPVAKTPQRASAHSRDPVINAISLFRPNMSDARSRWATDFILEKRERGLPFASHSPSLASLASLASPISYFEFDIVLCAYLPSANQLGDPPAQCARPSNILAKSGKRANRSPYSEFVRKTRH